MDIYSILSSKSHNLHYLIRYIKFIQACILKNEHYDGPIENHHICPKADDMFPEYICFKTHSWNKAPLTPRQHFIAHLMLWKAFPLYYSQTHAAWSMKWKNDMKVNSRIYESLKSDFRALSSEIHKGKVTVKDSDGNTYKVPNDDPRYLSGQLVGVQKSKVSVKDSEGNIFNVSTDDPRYLSGELVGVQKGKVSVKDSEGNVFSVSTNDPRYLSGELVALTAGMIGVKDKNGNTFRVRVDDPRYLSGELVPITKGMSWKIEDTKNYRKPKSKSHIENIKKWVSVTDPATMERKRVLKTDPLYVSGYYKGLTYGITKTEEQRKEISERFKGKKKKRCSCVICGCEVSVNNLDRHFGSKVCLRNKRHTFSFDDFTV